MKQAFYPSNLLRTIVMGAAVATAAFSFTACSDDAIEAQTPIVEVQSSQENGAVIPGKYIVVFKENENMRINPNASYTNRVELVREMGLQVFNSSTISNVKIDRVYGKAILGVVANLSETEVSKLLKDSRVAYIEPDRVISLGKPSREEDEVTTAAQETPWGINRVGMASGSGKTAWIIDTGIDLDHPDLKVNTSKSRTFITTGKDARSADDGNGHGTHVAGTIAAKNNSTGVIGVAYDATVVAVKVLNAQGSGSYSGVIAGLDYVAANASSGDVANMSLGGPASKALDDAVLNAANKGILFAIAAGNNGSHAGSYSPSRVNHSNVFTVSAMDINNRFASFSNFGNPPVDYCAPGESIKSTWKDKGYATISGTSMAAPHVAGLLLLAGGSPRTDGYVNNDPDGNPDPIAHR